MTKKQLNFTWQNTGVSGLPLPRLISLFVLMCDFGVLKGLGTKCDILTDQGSGRAATPVFCEVKLLFLSKESGGFEKSRDNGFSSSTSSVHPHFPTIPLIFR